MASNKGRMGRSRIEFSDREVSVLGKIWPQLTGASFRLPHNCDLDSVVEEAIGRSRYRDVSAVFKEAFGGYNLRGKKLPAQLQFLGGRLEPLDAFGRERAKEVVLLALARNQGQYIRSDSEVIIPVYPRAD